MADEGNEKFIRLEKFWVEVGLRAGQTMAHLGCGPGFYLIPAAKIVGEKGKAIGIDILEDKLAETEARAKRMGVEKIVRVARGNLENQNGSTLKEEMADFVLVANILHQSDPATILKEAKRILKPEGKVVVVEWSTAASPLGPPQEHRLARNDALEVAKEAGLWLAREFTPSPYHYGLLLAKG